MIKPPINMTGKMLPRLPRNPKLGSPKWLSPTPRLGDIDEVCKKTLSKVRFRDRYGRIWTVPRGYPTDGMSYPWIIRLFKDPYSVKTLQAAVLHDYSYSMYDYFAGWPVRRRTADLNLLDGLWLTSPPEAVADFIIVRMFGRRTFLRKSKDPIMIKWIIKTFAQD